jgi:Zn-dependent protease
MNWTFPLFRLFGIPVRMHWFMAIFIAGKVLQASVEEGAWGFRWMSVTMAILVVSILFHELAHCWMAIRLGAGAEQILIWPLGGLAFVGHTDSPQNEIKVSGIGPLSTFLLGGICLGILLLSGARWQWGYLNPWESWWMPGLNQAQSFVLHAVRLNLILGLFNLVVPAYPLDGGRVLYSFLTIRHGARRAAELTTAVALPVGLAMGIWGIAQNDLMLILIGAWVLVEAIQMRHLIRIGEFESHPAFAHAAPEFQYMPDRPKKPGFFARWRRRRAQRQAEREASRSEELRRRVDAVLEKVSREGIGSLSASERRILDEASRQTRGD